MHPTFEVYEDQDGEWRWRLKAANGEIVADSGEGYTRRNDCERAIGVVKQLVSDAGVKVEGTAQAPKAPQEDPEEPAEE